MKYIYIIGIVGLMGLWTQNVFAQDPVCVGGQINSIYGGNCITPCGKGTHESGLNGKCVPDDNVATCAAPKKMVNGACTEMHEKSDCEAAGGYWHVGTNGFYGGTCEKDPQKKNCDPGDKETVNPDGSVECKKTTQDSSTSTDCTGKPDRYIRSSMDNSCQPKLCIGHSNEYCKCIDSGKTLECKYNECIGTYYENGSYKQRGDQKFCDCVANGGTELAVSIPFVGGADGSDRCVPKSKSGEALPLLMGVIIQILNTLLLVGGFAMFVYAGVLYTLQGKDDITKAKKIMRGVFGAFALYGSLGMILKLINPALFT